MRGDTIKSDMIKKIVEDSKLGFGPQADNRTLISDPAGRRAYAAIAPVPVMIGSNSQEGRVFVQGQKDVLKYAQTTFGNASALVKAVVAAYPIGKNGLETGFDAIAQIMTDYSFQCVSDVFQPLVSWLMVHRIRLCMRTHLLHLVFLHGVTT